METPSPMQLKSLNPAAYMWPLIAVCTQGMYLEKSWEQFEHCVHWSQFYCFSQLFPDGTVALEDCLVCLLQRHCRVVVDASLSCLAIIVNNLTKDYTRVTVCFANFYGELFHSFCDLKLLFGWILVQIWTKNDKFVPSSLYFSLYSSPWVFSFE